jgi:methionine-rich copper-binding protein CopC
MGVLIAAAYAEALAHAEYVRSEPASGAVVAEPPARVVVYFSQQLDMSMSSISVVGPSGQVESVGQAKVLPDNPKAMYVDLKPKLANGTYAVRWTTMSAEDGEHASGQFSFSVGLQAPLPAGGLGLSWDLALALGLYLLVAGCALIGRPCASIRKRG